MTARIFFMIVLSIAALAFTPADLFCQPISIDLSLDKTDYSDKEPITAQIAVKTTSKSLYVNQEFPDLNLYEHLRIVDPAGRLVPSIKQPVSREAGPAHDPGPVFWRNDEKGRFIQVTPCVTYSLGKTPEKADLRKLYPGLQYSLPGEYSAQVTVSVTVFKPKDPCNINDPEWSGLLLSKVVHFTEEGSTKISVSPETWRLSWRTSVRDSDFIEVSFQPEPGRSLGNYDVKSIRLNGVAPKRVEILTEHERPYIKAYFDRQEAIASLGGIPRRQQQTVYLIGKLISGLPFGGSTKVTISK